MTRTPVPSGAFQDGTHAAQALDVTGLQAHPEPSSDHAHGRRRRPSGAHDPLERVGYLEVHRRPCHDRLAIGERRTDFIADVQ